MSCVYLFKIVIFIIVIQNEIDLSENICDRMCDWCSRIGINSNKKNLKENCLRRKSEWKIVTYANIWLCT